MIISGEAVVEEGRYGSELYVFSYRSRALGPSSVRANALPAPPEGKLLTFPRGGAEGFYRYCKYSRNFFTATEAVLRSLRARAVSR